MVGLGRGYGHKQITARCSTILKIINALSKTPYTYEQLWQVTKIQRNTLQITLDLLISKEMLTRSKEYSLQNGGKGRKREYYKLNFDHPIISVVVDKRELEVNIIEQLSSIALDNMEKSAHRLNDSNTFLIENKHESITKATLVEPPKDERPNCISKQFEYLIEDMKFYNDNFLKRYYPPERHQPYYAHAIWLLRQLFRQYSDNRRHRDLYDWSEIHLAHKGLHPSRKSAKELSARYGDKVRGYNKLTGEPIFGRKGLSKKHIHRKSKDVANYLQEFHKLMPLFLFMHILFKNKKEKLIVDHVIDRKQSKDFRKR